jgi:hypothetical protein
MAEPVLTSRGVRLSKDEVGEARVASMKAALVVQPRGARGFPQPTAFKVFQESERALYVPRCYLVVAHSRLPQSAPTSLEFEGTLRPQQRASTAAYLDRVQARGGAGMIVLGCGGGKTVLATHLIATLGVKTMVVVHKEFLMTQWRERIAQFLPGCRVGRIQGAHIDVEDKDVVMVSLKSLTVREYGGVLDGFGFVIYDECHHMAARVFCQALFKTNFRYVLGLTATPDRKDGLRGVVEWFLGPVVWTPDEVTARPEVDVARLTHPHRADYVSALNGNMDRVQMIGQLCRSPERVAVVASTAATLIDGAPERCILLLSERRGHLTSIHAALEELRPQLSLGYYVGGMTAAARAVTETGAQVILATFSMASEGMDIPRLNTLMLCSPKSDVVQSVGRILRRQHAHPLIVDVLDDHFENAARARRRCYSESGFRVRDVQSAAEFLRLAIKGEETADYKQVSGWGTNAPSSA